MLFTQRVAELFARFSDYQDNESVRPADSPFSAEWLDLELEIHALARWH
jgi:hypothetical protein